MVAMNTATCQHQHAQKHIPEQRKAQDMEGEHQTEYGTQELGFSICVFIYLKKQNQTKHMLIASQAPGNE